MRLSRMVTAWVVSVRRLLFVSPHFAINKDGEFSVAQVEPGADFRAASPPPSDLFAAARRPGGVPETIEKVEDAIPKLESKVACEIPGKEEEVIAAAFVGRVGEKRPLPVESPVSPEAAPAEGGTGLPTPACDGVSARPVSAGGKLALPVEGGSKSPAVSCISSPAQGAMPETPGGEKEPRFDALRTPKASPVTPASPIKAAVAGMEKSLLPPAATGVASGVEASHLSAGAENQPEAGSTCPPQEESGVPSTGSPSSPPSPAPCLKRPEGDLSLEKEKAPVDLAAGSRGSAALTASKDRGTDCPPMEPIRLARKKLSYPIPAEVAVKSPTASTADDACGPTPSVALPVNVPAPPQPPPLPEVCAAVEGGSDDAATNDGATKEVVGLLKSSGGPAKRRKKGTPPPDTLSGPSHELTRKCPSCDRMHNGLFGNGRFCGLRCSKTAGAKARWGPNSGARKATAQAKRDPGKSSARSSGRRGEKNAGGGRGVAKRGRGGNTAAGSRKQLAKTVASQQMAAEAAALHAAAIAAAMSPGVPGNVGPSGAYGVGRGVRLPGSEPAYDEGESSQGDEPVSDSVGLPPKKKLRENLLSSGVDAVSGGNNWIDRTASWKVDCTTKGLVGEIIGYFWAPDQTWHCGTLKEYRMADDAHLVAHFGDCTNGPESRWIHLRVVDPRFMGALGDDGVPISLSTECAY